MVSTEPPFALGHQCMYYSYHQLITLQIHVLPAGRHLSHHTPGHLRWKVEYGTSKIQVGDRVCEIIVEGGRWGGVWEVKCGGWQLGDCWNMGLDRWKMGGDVLGWNLGGGRLAWVVYRDGR